MKQILVLEPHEVARLSKGKTLMITTQAGDEIGLQFLPNGHGSQDTKEPVFKCRFCKATTTLSGKPISSPGSLTAHERKAHPKEYRDAKN